MGDIKLKAECRVWLTNQDGKYILGLGGANLLKAINEEKNLGLAAKKIGVSYRKAWNILKKIEEDLGESPVNTYKGGTGGGGGMELSEKSIHLLNTYNELDSDIKKVLLKFNN